MISFLDLHDRLHMSKCGDLVCVKWLTCCLSFILRYGWQWCGGLNLLLNISMRDTVFAIDTSIIHYIMFMLVCYIYLIFFQQKLHLKLLICKYYHNINFGNTMYLHQLECIPVGCIPATHLRYAGGVSPGGCTWLWCVHSALQLHIFDVNWLLLYIGSLHLLL